jgi:hypothetical protein
MEILDTFIENQGAISGNNATIAENQVKVYEAGLKAGLMQDPDYQEGYEDGRDAAMGVEWESIIDGSVPVGRAKEADYAKKADRATLADRATESGRAANAEEATHARTAGRATEATHSATADHATEADHASEADRAKEATNAGYATNAGHATTATSATNASKAATADEATYVRNAPLWNVDKCVGRISPSIELEKMKLSLGGVLVDVGAEESISKEIDIPMINSGKLYLCFKTKTFCYRDEIGDSFEAQVKADICVNKEIVETCGRTYTISDEGDFSNIHGSSDKYAIDDEYRQLLEVNAGEIVTIMYTFSLRKTEGDSATHASADLGVTDVHLKANIITAHTYYTLEVEV